MKEAEKIERLFGPKMEIDIEQDLEKIKKHLEAQTKELVITVNNLETDAIIEKRKNNREKKKSYLFRKSILYFITKWNSLFASISKSF